MSSVDKPVLVLDLDGTLVDSRPDLVAALNHATGSAGLPPVSPRIVGETVGQGARAMIARAHDHHGAPVDRETIEALVPVFLEYYQAHIADLSIPYPGVQQSLDTFVENGWLLAVCTNKHENLAKALLRALAMDQQFAAICGSNTFDVRKPDAGHLLKTIAAAGGASNRSIMVGDTATDINTAINAEIPSIVVDFGYAKEPVHTLGADHIISHFDELWPIIKRIKR